MLACIITFTAICLLAVQGEVRQETNTELHRSTQFIWKSQWTPKIKNPYGEGMCQPHGSEAKPVSAPEKKIQKESIMKHKRLKVRVTVRQLINFLKVTRWGEKGDQNNC